MLKLGELKAANGSTKKVKRLGRGMGSGFGKQCGKGAKGQKARSGGSIRLGFEGGQMPLYRRLPKRGFTSAISKKSLLAVSLEVLGKIADGADEISMDLLEKAGIISAKQKGKVKVKVLANGTISKKLNIGRGISVSSKAKSLISQAGGKVQK